MHSEKTEKQIEAYETLTAGNASFQVTHKECK